MATFSIIGDDDPFLHANLKRGERIYCESNAMVMMEDVLDLQGRMSGGFASALMRRLANGESFFQQHIEATRGDGDCLLSPTLPGAMRVMTVGAQQYMLSDGCFVAAESSVGLTVRTQSLGNAIFGQTGGFFIMETTGQGKIAVSGFGSMFELDVTPGKETIIDNAHVVCWDSRLQYRLSISTSQNSGLLGNLLNSQTSGEGMVLRFSGSGKVLVCSRNRAGFTEWLRSQIK